MRRSSVPPLSVFVAFQFFKLVRQAGRWAIFFAEKVVHGIARQSECGQPTHPAGAVHTLVVWAGGLSIRGRLARPLHTPAQRTAAELSRGNRRFPAESSAPTTGRDPWCFPSRRGLCTTTAELPRGNRRFLAGSSALSAGHGLAPSLGFQPPAMSIARSADGRTVGAVSTSIGEL